MNFAVIFHAIAILFILYKVRGEVQTDYCSDKLCRGLKHIGCKSNGTFARACSKDARIQPLSRFLRNSIVRRHNELRNKVAAGNFSMFKAAGHMCTMKWNEELAKLAELNVKRCIVKHDVCQNTADFHYVGQNIGETMLYKKAQVQDIALLQIEEWFNEYSATTMFDIESYFPQKSVHIENFTQMMQDKATHIGCAILRQNKHHMIQQYMACNYAFMNIRRRSVYRIEFEAASLCETGVNPDYPNLCSSMEECYVNKL